MRKCKKIDLKKVISVASLAPSPDNNCPWRFTLGENDLTLELAKAAKFNTDELRTLDYLSLGAVITNIKQEAWAQGFAIKVKYPHEKMPLKIDFNAAEVEKSKYYDGLFCRRTNRSLYANKSLPAEFLAACQSLIKDQSLALKMVTKKENKASLYKWAKLIARLDELRFRIKIFHAHLFEILKFSKKDLIKDGSGLWVGELQLPLFAISTLKLIKKWPILKVLNFFGLSKIFQFMTYQQLKAVSALGIINANLNDSSSLIKAGELFQEIWLIAESYGISLHPLGHLSVFRQMQQAPHPSTSQKDQIKKALLEIVAAEDQQLDNLAPVFLFRLGYAKKNKVDPYRPSIDTLVK